MNEILRSSKFSFYWIRFFEYNICGSIYLTGILTPPPYFGLPSSQLFFNLVLRLKLTFLWFFWGLAISWQGDLVFSILKSTRFLIEIALLSLISLTRRKLKIATLSVNLVSTIKSELRFDQFLKQCVFEDIKGKFRNMDPKCVRLANIPC